MRRKQLKEIDEIDKKLQNWKFIAESETIRLPDSLQTHNEVMEALQEENLSLVIVEAQKLLDLMRIKM